MRVNLDISDNIIYGITTEPLDMSRVVEVDDKTLNLIVSNLGCIDSRFNIITELKTKQEKKLRVAKLKELLNESDYKAIKYAEGAISEYDYISIRQERQAWRDEINALEGELIGD